MATGQSHLSIRVGRRSVRAARCATAQELLDALWQLKDELVAADIRSGGSMAPAAPELNARAFLTETK
ncbi:MAG TPA: hypothetical protein PKC13_27125 [Blastocatellia bacterium]|nr:hypothetical protein [Blastocatellia bacterium]